MLDSQRLRRHWPTALLFLALAAALLYIQWIGNAHRVLQELGDFAANGLLILDAKKLHLLYGNYSRIGVHHPGPAILYVLAAGEWLFHDVLHIAPSPFSGQLLAVCLYSAAWIALVFAMLRRLAGAVAPALLFTAVFVAALGCFEPSVFLGIWFPDLYMLPFAAAVVAISRLAYGRTDMLRALALSSGFLINGHVSFIPMLGVMLVAMLAANAWIARRDPALRIVSRAFLQRHRRDILAACAILFVFFIPLVVLTAIEFPGPLYDYVKFGRSDKHNSLGDAFQYVGMYWKPAYAWTWGVLLALVLASGLRAPSGQVLRDARACALAFVAASLALLYYAKAGIDQLDLVYIGLFYYTVPALAGALLATYLYLAIAWPRKAILAVLASATALGFGWQAANKPVYYDYLYDVRGSAQLYRQLQQLPGSGRVALDVGGEGMAWEYMWGDVAALMLYARRQGQDLVCVNEHWHILFTRAGRCRPEELNTLRHFFVRPSRMDGMMEGEPDLQGQRLLLYRHGRVLEPVVYDTVAERKDLFRRALGKSWSDADREFAWSIGPVAEITLPADPARGKRLHLDLGAFIPDNSFTQHLDVLVNGRRAGEGWDFDHVESRRQITVDLGAEPGAVQHIELHNAHPVSPKQYGMSEDARPLGVSLYGMR